MIHRPGFVSLLVLATLTAVTQLPAQQKEISLPSSKTLHLPAPGSPQRTNSLPTAIALSPDGKYLAILNNGYGAAGVTLSAVHCLARPEQQSGA